jgi:hypothetical protein
MGKFSVNNLRIPFSEHFEQPVSIAQHVNGVLLVRRFDGVFEPGGYAWICKDLFESHIYNVLRFWVRVMIRSFFEAGLVPTGFRLAKAALLYKAIGRGYAGRAVPSFCRESPQKVHKVAAVRQARLETERSFRPQRTGNGIF